MEQERLEEKERTDKEVVVCLVSVIIDFICGCGIPPLIESCTLYNYFSTFLANIGSIEHIAKHYKACQSY